MQQPNNKNKEICVYEGLEVRKTGRTASQSPSQPRSTRRRIATTPKLVYEITPCNLDQGSWTKWVPEDDLFTIDRGSETNNYILSEYDTALSTILEQGTTISDDRTGVGTKFYPNLNTSYDISKRAPILTKRAVSWLSIVKEVLWYISGSHNINDLEDTGSKIWTPWKNNEFTKKHGFEEGSGGYIYGFNLIHFGANIQDDDPKGFNQLDYVIEELRHNKQSRQACFTFWRPDTNDRAVLPACHAFYHFYLEPDNAGQLNQLSCHVFQRSNDYPIGVGMGNLLTAYIFTCLIAHQINASPKTLYHSGSHCHIYNNAIDAATEYSDRKEAPNSPILDINHHYSIYDYVPDDFSISDYNPLPPIKFNIAI